jgi:hypothetical protein
MVSYKTATFFKLKGENGETDDKLKRFLSSKLESNHQFQSLIQIGFELLISIFQNGHLKANAKSKFTFGKI